MNKKISDNEILKMFQRYLSTSDPSEVNKLNPDVLAAAESRLALKGINRDFLEAIKNKRKDLMEMACESARKAEKEVDIREQRKYEKQVRIGSIITAFAVGVAVTIASQWLWSIIKSST